MANASENTSIRRKGTSSRPSVDVKKQQKDSPQVEEDEVSHLLGVCTMADASENSSIGRKGTSSRPSVDVKKQQKDSPQVEEDEVYHLLGVPFFDVVLTKSHLERLSTLSLPTHMVQLLPRATVPVILTYNGKNWNLSYRGDCVRPAFDSEWRGFATDNDLKCGDACVFELMENSQKNLKFKVHILRGDLPPELKALVESRGTTSDSPIVLE